MANADIPGAVTIVDREWSGIVMMLTCSVVVLAALGLVNAPAWVRHGDTAAVVAYAVAVVIALASACARAWRMQLRIDEDGVTIRNFYRMHRIGWSEIGQFEDGSRWLGWEASEVWVRGAPIEAGAKRGDHRRQPRHCEYRHDHPGHRRAFQKSRREAVYRAGDGESRRWHGQGTARRIACYGITEEFCGCPIASMDTVIVGQTAEGFPVHFDRYACEADHVSRAAGSSRTPISSATSKAAS